jgi:cytochrome P450
MPQPAHDAADQVALRLFETPEGRTNPYPLYHELRELEPVHKSSLGMWLISRYDDISAVLRDPRFGKNFAQQMETTVGPRWREHPSITRRERSMLNLDGADHTRLRTRVIKAFKKRQIDALRPTIQHYVDQLLEPYAEAGGGDLIEDFAFPLPVNVIGEMLGVPEPDRAQFRQLVGDLVAILEVGPTDEMLAKADEAEETINRYFSALIAEKRRSPDDAILSQLIQADADDPLDDAEVIGMATLLFGAGFETTTNLIGNSLWGLLQHPEQIQKLRDDPALFADLPDELLRYDGTAQVAARYATDDVEVGGVVIPEGESVLTLLGAGNHDPAEYERPDEIDVTRKRFRPVALGGGIHFCLGASLAKAEIEITFRALLDRFESIELASGPPHFRDRLVLRGLESLELVCKPKARAARSRVVVPAASFEAASVEAPPTELPSADAQAVRPVPSSGAEDAAWRNALRSKVESDSRSVRSGSELLSTVVLLARAGLFARCTPAEVEELAATAYPMSFEPGERLTLEGAESLDCYVVAEGEAEVSIAGRFVRHVRERDAVGERGPLEDKARSATVTATSHMVTYAISRERLLALAARSPTAREGMLAYIRDRYDDA